MRVVSLRFPDPVWDLIGREAALIGVSRSQFIREAALARAYYFIARRASPAQDEKYQALWIAAGEMLATEMEMTRGVPPPADDLG